MVACERRSHRQGQSLLFTESSRSRVLLLGFVLLHTLARTVTAQATLVRTLLVGGPLPARYLARIADFGNPLDGTDGNDMVRTYNLMVPRDNPWLCEFPKSFADLSQNQTDHIRENQDELYPNPVALFISINRCSAEQKAKVALEIQQKITSKLELLVVYSPNPDSNKLITLLPDGPTDGKYGSVGIVHIPYRYASGIESRMRMLVNALFDEGHDPRFDGNDSEWAFPIQLSNYTGVGGDGGSSSSDRSNSGGGDIYWFRIILFAILVLSPCCRACYLWYAGGGRFYFRRNANGRITGIQYVPPAPQWLGAGRIMGGQQETNPTTTRTGTLTEEQFNTLPEIEYQPIASHYDEDNEGADNRELKGDSEGSERKAEPEKETDEHRSKNESEDVFTDAPDDAGNDEDGGGTFSEAADDIEQGEAKRKVDTGKEEGSGDNHNQRDDADGMERGEATGGLTGTSTDVATEGPLACRSTMCSICIDDFEPGEKIILLPRCQHGFHRDCIRPWLTERQGCCPFCKTSVFAEDEAATAAESGDSSDENGTATENESGDSPLDEPRSGVIETGTAADPDIQTSRPDNQEEGQQLP